MHHLIHTTHLSWNEPLSVKESFMSLNSSLLPSLFRLAEPTTLTDAAFILHIRSIVESG